MRRGWIIYPPFQVQRRRRRGRKGHLHLQLKKTPKDRGERCGIILWAIASEIGITSASAHCLLLKGGTIYGANVIVMAFHVGVVAVHFQPSTLSDPELSTMSPTVQATLSACGLTL